MATKNFSISRLLIAGLSRHGIICIVEDDHEIGGIIKEDVNLDARIKEYSGKFELIKSVDAPNEFTITFNDEVDDEYKEKILTLLKNSDIVKKNNVVINTG